ncbi:uncharacterized protein LOC111049626 [Nilaparvata lugens]|uniref:uncharacterized protein LOC111049626 n=1 Tax=Nilaparvata lugens TaxID=108931 RepID=UPI00193E4776|nr:uncharacterized protein LOC111049626 [Nilaparvata lugens]
MDCCRDRTTWCQRIPDGHDENICHNVSVRKRNILNKMRVLVNNHYNDMKCEQWDTQETLNNTKGPYRIGVIKPEHQHQELIGSQLVQSCECGKRNGLQDDCRRWSCRGSPQCRTTPLPKCKPFLGQPSDRKRPAYKPPQSDCVPRPRRQKAAEKDECRHID